MNGVFLTSASNPKKHDALKLAQFLASKYLMHVNYNNKLLLISLKYTFIHIPWWWDGKFASLQAIISILSFNY